MKLWNNGAKRAQLVPAWGVLYTSRDMHASLVHGPNYAEDSTLAQLLAKHCNIIFALIIAVFLLQDLVPTVSIHPE